MKIQNILNRAINFILIFFIVESGIKAKEKKGKVTEGLFIDNGCFYLKYSSIIDEVNGKRIEIPIYGGTLPSQTYKNLEKAMGDDNRDIYGLCFKPKKGETKKMFLDILHFYKKSLFKDIDIEHPTVIGGESESWIIWYDFTYQGVIGSIMFQLPDTGKGIPNPKNIRDIVVGEEGEVLGMSISMGGHSPFYKKK